MDNRVVVFLISLGAVGLALAVGGAVGMDDLDMPILLVIVAAGLALLAKPEWSAFLVVSLYASGLTAPGLPGAFNLYNTSILAVFGATIVLLVFRRRELPSLEPSRLFLIAFCLVVLITGLYRGLGFQFLGSSMWGGYLYLSIFFPATLVFTLPVVNMPDKWWQPAIIAMGLLAPVPLIADLLVVHGFNFGIIHMFMQNGATIGMLVNETENGEGLGRLTSAGIAAQSMVIAFLAVFHTSKLFSVRSPLAIGILASITILSLLSGFRMMTAMLLFVVLLAALFQKTLTGPRVIFGFMVISLTLIVLYGISDRLPYNVQRTISWLPGISVSSVADRDAQGTIIWRLDLWQQSIRFIPDYFWIGKGFSYDANLYLASLSGYASYDSINWALVTGAYHNGYLSLLLVLGIFGLLTGLPLLIMVVVRHVRKNFEPWNNPILHQCHQAFLASETCWMLIYLTIYGDVSAVYPQFFFNWAIMEALCVCDAHSKFVSFTEESVVRSSRADEELLALE